MEVDVVVIGGGATGCGVAWDLSLRGLSVALFDMGDIASGTSGRYHGLLHSGGRYAVSDPATAQECFKENVILKRIARRCIDDCGGLFVRAPGSDAAFVHEWTEGCRRAGIPFRRIDLQEALRREPGLDPGVHEVFEIPDAVCRSQPLCASLAGSAKAAGAGFHPFHRLHGITWRTDGARIALTDVRSAEELEVDCRLVVNAAGPWSGRVAEIAGVRLRMDLVRGAMLAFEGPCVRGAVNSLAPSSDGDIILPRGKVCIAGTTAVVTEDPGDRRIEEWEIALVRERIGTLIPGIRQARLVHAWSAVRPLYDPSDGGDGAPRADPRMLSRDFSVIDHQARDGVRDFLTIVGGKLTTFRLMAEKTADAVCRKLGVKAACRTAETELE